MTHLAPSAPGEPARMSVAHYLGLIAAGVLGPRAIAWSCSKG
jgi:hypothetical protein